jgi:hypothetical protein
MASKSCVSKEPSVEGSPVIDNEVGAVVEGVPIVRYESEAEMR